MHGFADWGSRKDINEWREVVFWRDNYRCQKCQSRRDIEAHHIRPKSRFPQLELLPGNGLTLCKKCHSIEHVKSEKLTFHWLAPRIRLKIPEYILCDICGRCIDNKLCGNVLFVHDRNDGLLKTQYILHKHCDNYREEYIYSWELDQFIDGLLEWEASIFLPYYEVRDPEWNRKFDDTFEDLLETRFKMPHKGVYQVYKALCVHRGGKNESEVPKLGRTP